MNSTDKATTILIAANLIVFLLLRIPGYSESALPYLELSGSASVAVRHPWTLLTYAFTQVDFWHVTVNMLWLAFFGVAMVEKGPDRQWCVLVGLYIVGAIAAGIAFCVVVAIAGASLCGYALLGASSGIWALGIFKVCQWARFHSRMVFNPRGLVILGLALLFLYKFYNPDFDTQEFALTAAAHGTGALVGLLYFLFTLKHPDRGERNETRPTQITDITSNPLSSDRQGADALQKARVSGYASLTETERRQLQLRR